MKKKNELRVSEPLHLYVHICMYTHTNTREKYLLVLLILTHLCHITSASTSSLSHYWKVRKTPLKVINNFEKKARKKYTLGTGNDDVENEREAYSSRSCSQLREERQPSSAAFRCSAVAKEGRGKENIPTEKLVCWCVCVCVWRWLAVIHWHLGVLCISM